MPQAVVDVLKNDLAFLSMYNAFMCMMIIFFVWGWVENLFKIVCNIFTGKTYFGKKDYRLERYSK